MEKSKDLEYIDLKQGIETAIKIIKDCKTTIAVNSMMLEKLEEEIKKYPKPTDKELKAAGENTVTG